MKPMPIRWIWALMVAAALALAGCASVNPDNLKPGASADEITKQMGQPRATYPLPNGGKRLEFRGNGARTFMIDVDAAGRMVGEPVQVLNETNFRNVRAGMTREELLMTLGQPDNVAGAGRQGGQILSWHYINSQCLWFQVAVGTDGRVTGPGSTSMMQVCMNTPS